MSDSAIRDRSVAPRDYEVHVTVYGRDDDEGSSYAIQRAPDSAGSPDTGNAEVVGSVGSGGGTFVDRPPNLDGHYYRAREEREGYDDSAWTDWTRRYRGKLTPVEDPVPAPRRSIGANTDRETGGVTVKDVIARIRDSGNARNTFGIHDGAATHAVAHEVLVGTARHEGAVSFADFGVTFQNPPEIVFIEGGATVHAGGLTGQYVAKVRAIDKTAAGFTLDARLEELVGTTTPRTASFSSGHGTGPPWQANNTNAEAWDDKYNYKYAVTIQPDSAVVVEFWANDGTGWELVASRGFWNEDPVNPVTHNAQVEVIEKDGLFIDVSTNEFGMDIDEITGTGSITPDEVAFDTATAPGFESKTPTNAPDITWIAVGR